MKVIKMKNLWFILFLISAFSCSQISRKSNPQGFMVGATLWVQNAAEYRALSYQAFNLAKLRLNADIQYATRTKKRAVVVDVDETVLDNSPFQAKLIIEGDTYNSENWKEWTNQANARALPGAKEFLNWANKKGVEVFYVTNRKITLFDATYKNLKEAGFPIKKENLLMKTTKKTKEPRRKQILAKHHIVLLMGDTLGDFAEIFDGKPLDARATLVDTQKNQWGKKFIVLPNPLYGDWEWALYNNDYKISPNGKQKAWEKHLYPEPLN
ncbi:MAG: 5'-nucleotidase, lipoprotein e(P4) family [Halobacteriovorax sp.]|nr:5'-nucleotidase, lipoprotein e(P4) family [Halobacteriovorax sp.]